MDENLKVVLLIAAVGLFGAVAELVTLFLLSPRHPQDEPNGNTVWKDYVPDAKPPRT